MPPNTGDSAFKEPALTELDRKHIDRLLQLGQLESAAKIYRGACRCSAKEARLAIQTIVKDRESE